MEGLRPWRKLEFCSDCGGGYVIGRRAQEGMMMIWKSRTEGEVG